MLDDWLPNSRFPDEMHYLQLWPSQVFTQELDQVRVHEVGMVARARLLLACSKAQSIVRTHLFHNLAELDLVPLYGHIHSWHALVCCISVMPEK